MYCYHCGKEVGESDSFCRFCGTRLVNPSTEAPLTPTTAGPLAPAVPAKMSALPVVGFSLALLGLTGGLVAFLFVGFASIGFFSGIAGLILSIVGIVRNNKLGGNRLGKSFAIAGIVLNAASLVLATLAVSVYSVLLAYDVPMMI